MASVDVKVGGKSYRMAVEPGQEHRLRAVAERLDSYVSEMKAAAPNMERDNLLVMAGMTLADAFLSVEQQRAQEIESLDKFHNHLADRLQKIMGTTGGND